MENPWYIVFDTECTAIDGGEIIEIGAIRVNKTTQKVVGEYRQFLPKSENAVMSVPGTEHYNHVSEQCESALPRKYILMEAVNWMRGPTCYDPPLLVGYYIKKHDLPKLLNSLPEFEFSWLKDAKVYDVATSLVNKLWPVDKDSIRSLENVADTLGIAHATPGCHNPVEDCKLTKDVMLAIKDKKPGEVPSLNKKQIWDPETPENIEWAMKRYGSVEYTKIKCPFCGKPEMLLLRSRKLTVDSADQYFYKCELCKETLNIDGTKGKGKKRTPMFDIETLRLV